MELILEKKASKGLDRMSEKAAESLSERLRVIADNPHARHANVERMAGSANTFRLRQGDWRAVYRLDFERKRMVVIRIDVRGSVYR